MVDWKLVSTPLGGNFKLSSKKSPTYEHEKEEMGNIPYTSVVGSLMFIMVGTRLNLAYSVSLVSRLMSNLDKKHWVGIKWIIRYLKGIMNIRLIYRNDSTTDAPLSRFIN